VLLRAADELRALVRHAPFPVAHPTGRHVRRQFALLRSSPSTQARDRVLALATEEDRLTFGSRELLWISQSHGSESKLNLRAIEKLIGPWTMRTMETIEQIVSRYFA
jgi:uncharacterized protein (DUF1697 family)